MISVAVPLTIHAGGQTCVWMDAGLLAYRLCDRGFDCEHCPLDAAMSGACQNVDPFARRLPAATCPTTTFPDDRRYARGHTWARLTDEREGRVRVGVDGFAAPIIRRPLDLHPGVGSPERRTGELLASLEIEEGQVPISMPLGGTVAAWNPALGEEPSLVTCDPYGAGWLAELVGVSNEALAGLLSPEAARRQGQFDARRYRRRLAYELLSDAEESELPAWSASGTELSRLLGSTRFLAMVREFVH